MRDDSVMALVFRRGRSNEPPGATLLRELIDRFNEIYPNRGARPGSATTADEMVAPHGVFLVGHEEERPVAIGGVRALHDEACEIKRM